ncbi:hypothetical protein BDN71DRAFT_1430159 [Pleurotus eryngii]|uniref:Uncharacterized protein n=1 Tax=Pleurotus eryngii TaxID=5323 RepID=A0A9P6D853_PLEER|nr:hypothetical protein BDN71DRAFT_1430159 [Pleurotus eryngii]
MNNENMGRHDPPRDQSATGPDDNGPQGTNVASQSMIDIPMSPGELPQSPRSTHHETTPTPVQATSESDEQSRLSQEAYNLTQVRPPPLPHLLVIHTKWNMYKPGTFGCSPSCTTRKEFQIHQFVAAMAYSDTYDDDEPSSSDEEDRRRRNQRKDKSRAAGGNDKPNWPELGPPGQASYLEAVSTHGYDTRHTRSTTNWAPGPTGTNNVPMPRDEAEWDQWSLPVLGKYMIHKWAIPDWARTRPMRTATVTHNTPYTVGTNTTVVPQLEMFDNPIHWAQWAYHYAEQTPVPVSTWNYQLDRRQTWEDWYSWQWSSVQSSEPSAPNSSGGTSFTIMSNAGSTSNTGGSVTMAPMSLLDDGDNMGNGADNTSMKSPPRNST